MDRARVAVLVAGGVVLVGGAVAFVVSRRGAGDDVDDEGELVTEGAAVPMVSSDVERVDVGSRNGAAISVTLLRITDRHELRTDAARAYRLMTAAAARDGINLVVNSAFRSRAEQARLRALYEAGQGALAARPGYSTHEAGESVDISTRGLGQASAEYKWLKANAARFGFVNDVSSEPWHWTFKG